MEVGKWGNEILRCTHSVEGANLIFPHANVFLFNVQSRHVSTSSKKMKKKGRKGMDITIWTTRGVKG